MLATTRPTGVVSGLMEFLLPDHLADALAAGARGPTPCPSRAAPT